jgi:carbon monoxide dehydrogenase subunit G
MQLRENHSLPVPLAAAWAALNDLVVLQQAIPGCESLVETAADAFDAAMAMPMGPLTTRFTTHILRREVDAPHSCTLHFKASMMAASAAGSAVMHLRANGSAASTLRIDIDVCIDGMLGQWGSGLIDLAAQQMADQFFTRFRSGAIARHARPACHRTRP